MSTAIVWLRQDLRLCDNLALSTALENHQQVILLYILDEINIRPLGGASRWWLHHSLQAFMASLAPYSASLCLKRGDPQAIITSLLQQEKTITAIYWNRLYEPQAIARDTQLKSSLKNHGINVHSFNGSLLTEPTQIKTGQQGIFKVFTPYARVAKKTIAEKLTILPAPKKIPRLTSPLTSDELTSWDLLPTQPDWSADFTQWQPGERGAQERLEHFIAQDLENYAILRDRPDSPSTSYLSPHLHFGEISPRQIWQTLYPLTKGDITLSKGGEMLLRQLLWREFSTYLLYHFPELPEKSFRPQFDQFPWQTNEVALRAWQQGRTGFPLVDAGMRELWKTGYMHNRVRMITASFLTKDLLIDWRRGEQWFWDTLVDADLANNIASWQWVAGCGADAAPYFRIFNPTLQSQKFDPNGDYIRRYLPVLSKLPPRYIHQPHEAPPSILAEAGLVLGENYPQPIVDHKQARRLALEQYGKIKTARQVD